jgi:4-hydroxymandelate oxidase
VADPQRDAGAPPDVAALIDALAAQAEGLLEPATYGYFAGGSGREVSLEEARGAWLRYRFLPRVLRDVSGVDTSVELLGSRLPSPLVIAPVAYQGLLDEGGEVAVAAGAAGHLMTVATRASRALEEIAAAATGPWWFQVYVTADRSLSSALVRRAAAAGARALVLTGDTPYIARKARAGRPTALGAAHTMTNFAPHLAAGADPALATEQNPGVTVDDIARLADESGLPVLVKGVLRGDDAAACLAAGAAGLVVSNHGGRQLDRALAPALALPDVVAAAGDAPVLVDGGIRSGTDVLAALALGARGVLLGRPVAWALACAGAQGVTDLLTAFTGELAHVLGLAGCTRCAEATPDLVVRV